MRIRVNLASRPFVELRPFFLRLRIIMAGLAVVAVGLLIWTHSLNQKLDTARAKMDSLQAATDAARKEKAANESRMHQPENAAVLTRAHFLNALFLRKSFSWTAVMMDLETVMPTGVQITAIEPHVAADGDVIIQMRVGGDRDRAIQFVRNLERSKRFQQPQLTGESPAAKDNVQQGRALANNGAPAGVEFEILARYNPITGEEAAASAKPDRPAANSASVHKKPGKTPVPGAMPPKAVQPKAAKPGTLPRKGATR